MADETRASIEIDAPPERVMAVLADLEAYPEWVDSMAETEVVSRDTEGRPEQVQIVMRHPVISETCRLGYQWEPERVAWRLLAGQRLTAMDGSYQVVPVGSGCSVTYRLAVELSVPLPGLIRRRAEKAIVTSALQGLRSRVLAG